MNNSNTRKAFWIPLVYVLLLFVVMSFDADTDQLAIINTTSISFLKVSQVITVTLIFILPAVLFVLFFTPEKWRYFLLHNMPSRKIILLGVIIMPLAWPFINALGEWNDQLKLPEMLSNVEIWMRTLEDNAVKLTEYFLEMNSLTDLLVNLFVIAFMAALAEELFFRGVLQTTLIKATNIHVGVWVTAILFSAIHMQFYGFIPRIIMGAVLGYLFVWSGSLWMPILAHFINNGVAVLLSYCVQQGTIDAGIETVGSAKDELLIALSSLVIITGVFFQIRRISTPVKI